MEDIRKIVDQGEYSEAFVALEELLEMGPYNIEALKLKALVYRQQGRYQEEFLVWQEIIEYYPDDEDSAEFFEKNYIEEKERFYFTEELPGGGRRFVIHPKALVNSSLFGLIGCLLFLLISNYSRKYVFLANPTFSFVCFLVLVLTPWAFILYNYLKAPCEIHLTYRGISVVSRMGRTELRWEDIAGIHLAHQVYSNQAGLSMVFVPYDRRHRAIEIDLANESSVLKAKSFFIRETCRFYGQMTYSSRRHLNRVIHQVITV